MAGDRLSAPWSRVLNEHLPLVSLRPLLAKITCPVLIMHAPDDSLVPFDNVAYMKENFGEGIIREVVELRGKGHFIPWNAEPEIREAILRLAAEDAPGGSGAEDETVTD